MLLPELHNITLCTSKWYGYKHNVKFFSPSWTPTTDTAQKSWLYQLIKMASPRPFCGTHFAVCWHRAVQLNFILQNDDDIINPDRLLVNFPTCAGPPQLIQSGNYYFTGRRYWNGKPPFLLTSPLWLCVEAEQCETIQDDVMSTETIFSNVCRTSTTETVQKLLFCWLYFPLLSTDIPMLTVCGNWAARHNFRHYGMMLWTQRLHH